MGFQLVHSMGASYNAGPTQARTLPVSGLSVVKFEFSLRDGLWKLTAMMRMYSGVEFHLASWRGAR